MAEPRMKDDAQDSRLLGQADGPKVPDPRAILSSIGEVIYNWDLTTDALSFGPNVADVLSFADFEQCSSGRHFAEYLSPASPSSRYEAIMESGATDTGAGVCYRVIYALIDKPSGTGARATSIWIEDNGRWFAGFDGHPGRAHGTIRVITDRYEAERELAQQSRCDPLTGALTRSRFTEHVVKLLAECPRKGDSFGLLLVGIDNLALLNRSYGYDVGDEVVAAVVARIKAQIRTTDLVARYAGNKFVMLIEACTAEQMHAAAHRFLDAIDNEPLQTTVGRIEAALRIGGVVGPQQGRTAPTLFHNVEEALEAACRSSHTRFVAYADDLAENDGRVEIQNVSDRIVAALNQSRILLAKQPIVSAKTGEICFYEALMRIADPQGHLILPADILPIAEKTGLVQLIDHRMLELAVQELAGNPALRLAVNASGATVTGLDWPERLRAACAINESVAPRLTIEIGESCAVADLDATARAITAMKACGVKVAVDNFGAGHASFRSLRNLHFDLVKIDGAFVQNLARSDDDKFFVRTLIELARHLEIPTVAEWVEDAKSAKILTEWGVDYLQGRYFGQAEPAGASARLSAQREPDVTDVTHHAACAS